MRYVATAYEQDAIAYRTETSDRTIFEMTCDHWRKCGYRIITSFEKI